MSHPFNTVNSHSVRDTHLGFFKSLDWASFFWFGGMAIFLSWALSGCVWGNKEVDVPYTGPLFYETQFANVQLCVTLTGQTSPTCATETSSSYIPPIGGGYVDLTQLSNPVMVASATLQDDATDTALVYSSPAGDPTFTTGETPTFAIDVNSAAQTFTHYETANIDFFYNVQTQAPTCSFFTSFNINGSFTSKGPFTTGTTLSLSGRMPVVLNSVMSPQGTGCAQAAACYNDPTQCDGNTWTTVQTAYQAFINAGILTGANIANVANVSYQITYQ